MKEHLLLPFPGSPLWLLFFALKIYQRWFKKPEDEKEPKEKVTHDGTSNTELTKPFITMASIISSKEENV